jgi:hypothetical protein
MSFRVRLFSGGLFSQRATWERGGAPQRQSTGEQTRACDAIPLASSLSTARWLFSSALGRLPRIQARTLPASRPSDRETDGTVKVRTSHGRTEGPPGRALSLTPLPPTATSSCFYPSCSACLFCPSWPSSPSFCDWQSVPCGLCCRLPSWRPHYPDQPCPQPACRAVMGHHR